MSASLQDIRRAPDGQFDLLHVFRLNSLFADLPESFLREILGITTTVRAYNGQTLIEEGDDSREIFLLLSGKVKIQIESITPYVEIGITKLGSGEVIGEMALLQNGPRCATVVASEASELARIPAAGLQKLMERHPEIGVILMRNLARILAERLRGMNRRMINYVRTRYY